jgi:hypothetical protein
MRSKDFFALICKLNPALFPRSQQLRYFRNHIYIYFKNHILKDILKEVEREISQRGPLDTTDIKNMVSDVINLHYNKLRKVVPLPTFKRGLATQLRNKYKSIIREVCRDAFEKLPLKISDSNKLGYIASNLFVKDIFASDISGLVIAGFGTEDIFPSMQSFIIEGIIDNHVKYKQETTSEIAFDQTAYISAFAQNEMVATFMDGIDPSQNKLLSEWLKIIFNNYPDLIVDINKRISKSQKEKLKQASNKVVKEFFDKIEKFRYKNYVEPIINMVSVLPKDELANMAETFVSLTSFKRKMSEDVESVGGPVDVALISKSDGFIWIKRKQYFEKDQNLNIINNYFSR